MRPPKATVVFGVVVMTSACGRPLANDDEVGDEASETAGETETNETSDESSATDTEGEDGCGGFSLEREFVPPNVMLVVDVSSSMGLETWDHDGDPLTPEVTRWSSARALVETLVDELGASAELGVQRFPAVGACPNGVCTDADVCFVEAAPEVAVGPSTKPVILATLPEANAGALELVGGTPTSAAFESAFDHLVAQALDVPKSVVLITDGGANCGDGLSLPDSFEVYDESLVARVADAFNLAEVPTYVVGIDVDMAATPGEDSPQVDALAALNEVALAGGMPVNEGMDAQKFYGPSQVEELVEDVLHPIADDPVGCTLDLTMLPDGPPDPNQIPFVTIEIDDMPVPFVEDCASEAGWTWVVEGEILSFCGSWCEQFQTAALVEGDYNCPNSP